MVSPRLYDKLWPALSRRPLACLNRTRAAPRAVFLNQKKFKSDKSKSRGEWTKWKEDRQYALVKSVDHRELGLKSALWTHHPSSPGCPLFLPAGTRIFSKLVDMLRQSNETHGYQEVITPTIYKADLWKQSGHWQHYKDDMFTLSDAPRQVQNTVRSQHSDRSRSGVAAQETDEYGMKPMNCPAHCLLYLSKRHSYRELPIRYAEFSALHRNENSGSLSGLTRVRRFHQDDGHIFCRMDQVVEEVKRELQLMKQIYERVGLRIREISLSTQSASDKESYMGDKNDWDSAVGHLQKALSETDLEYKKRPGEAAFYGPKIDVLVADRDGRTHQTATIQLDLQTPKNFDLKYHGSEPMATEGTKQPVNHPLKDKKMKELMRAAELLPGDNEVKKDVENSTSTAVVEESGPGRPVMIHRALLGSLERFMALLAEHFKISWPFFLSPKQVIVLTVSNQPLIVKYAEFVAKQLRDAGFHRQAINVDMDISAETLAKKIAKVRTDSIRYNVIAVVGAKNLIANTVDFDIADQPNREASMDVIKKFERRKIDPIAQSKLAAGRNRGLEATRMSPDDFVRVMRKWEESWL